MKQNLQLKISNQPPKGTSDWTPEEFRIRKYIFDKWRAVCESFGYEEYLTPIIENAEIYKAKSGEDVGGKELMMFKDKAERELAIRPEMTPSVTRMVSRIYNNSPKPLRLFSIANFIRNEKPQRGRNREFWQLNFDVFGSTSMEADLEILRIVVEILKSFGADENQFKIKINDRNILRGLIISYLGIPEDKIIDAVRLLDKFAKLSLEEFISSVKQLEAQVYDDGYFWNTFAGFMEGEKNARREVVEKYIKGNILSESFTWLLDKIEKSDLSKYIEWDPSLARGFDYYDEMVFEVFDKNPENSRAMFGGGRYNGLASIFGIESFPAVGCAPGDETFKLFLQGWDLIPQNLKKEVTYIPILDESLTNQIQNIAKKLRAEDRVVEVGLETQKLGKALQYADSKLISKVVILGTNEAAQNVYVEKNMITGEQNTKEL